MREAFTAFFRFFTTLFNACDKGAQSLDHLASWAEGETGALDKEARVARAKRLQALEQQDPPDLKEAS